MATLSIIHNPTAGGAKRLRRVLSALERQGFVLELSETKARGDATRLAEAAAAEGTSLILASGGDGTIAEVVNGLAGSQTALAIFPAGTANVLAREWGVTGGADQLLSALDAGETTEISLGALRGQGADARKPWYFTTMAGIGFDAHVVAGVSLELKRAIGKGAYVWAAGQMLLRHDQARYRVTIDGAEREAASLIVSNGRFYAGRYLVAPEANLTGPEFHVGLLRSGGRGAILASAWAMGRGSLAEHKNYKIIKGRNVEVSGPVGDPVQADGDIVASLPVRIEICPKALRLLKVN
jgi:YegS/Rv2252/BmrU family lipid kinase